MNIPSLWGKCICFSNRCAITIKFLNPLVGKPIQYHSSKDLTSYKTTIFYSTVTFYTLTLLQRVWIHTGLQVGRGILLSQEISVVHGGIAMVTAYRDILKEKLPQAFMQSVWMEDDFRNLTAKVWANLDNPIKRYDFSKVSLIPCMSPSQVALF